MFRIGALLPGSEYRLRVCAVRQTRDSSGDLIGPFSQAVSFFTESQKPVTIGGSMLGSLPVKSMERRKWSDQQWAVLLLLCFTLFAIFLAFLAQQIISHTTGGGTGTGPADSFEDEQIEENATADMLG